MSIVLIIVFQCIMHFKSIHCLVSDSIAENETVTVSGAADTTKWFYFDLEAYKGNKIPMIQVLLTGGSGNSEINVYYEGLYIDNDNSLGGCSNKDIDNDNEEICHVLYEVGRFYIMVYGVSDYFAAKLKWSLIPAPWTIRHICANTEDPYKVTSKDINNINMYYYMDEWKLSHITGMDIIAWNDGHMLSVYDPFEKCKIENFDNIGISQCSYNDTSVNAGYYYIQVIPGSFDPLPRIYDVNVMLRLYYKNAWRLYTRDSELIRLKYWYSIFYPYSCIGTKCWFFTPCIPSSTPPILTADVTQWDDIQKEWTVFEHECPETAIQQCISHCTATRNIYIYYFGNNGNILKYNMITNQYEINDIPTPFIDITNGCVVQDEMDNIYLIGSRGNDIDSRTYLQIYKWSVGQWTFGAHHTLNDLTATTCTYHDGSIYTFGGLIDPFIPGGPPVPITGIYQYNVLDDMWISTKISDLMFPNFGMRQLLDETNGFVYIFGGYGYSNRSIISPLFSGIDNINGADIGLHTAFDDVIIDTSLSLHKSLVQVFDYKIHITKYETSFFNDIQTELIENAYLSESIDMTRLVTTYIQFKKIIWSRNVTFIANKTENITQCFKTYPNITTTLQVEPTDNLTIIPTWLPTIHPTINPSSQPTDNPTLTPTYKPTSLPTDVPTTSPICGHNKNSGGSKDIQCSSDIWCCDGFKCNVKKGKCVRSSSGHGGKSSSGHGGKSSSGHGGKSSDEKQKHSSDQKQKHSSGQKPKYSSDSSSESDSKDDTMPYKNIFGSTDTYNKIFGVLTVIILGLNIIWCYRNCYQTNKTKYETISVEYSSNEEDDSMI
eukprot:453558_1